MAKQFEPAASLTARVSSPTGRLTILFVGPPDEDYLSMQAIISHSNWTLLRSEDLLSAAALLEQHEIPVVVCERGDSRGTWIEVLEHIKGLSNAPSLIVASKAADDRLWAEALNLGAWDVLAKPFHHREVFHSVRSGWQHWHDRTGRTGDTTLPF
jgi:DNA-binding NtrC family response regulator